MQEFNVLENVRRVRAPEGFEQDVLRLLQKRKMKQGRSRGKAIRLSLGWAFSTAVAVFVVVNFLVIPQRGPSDYAGLEAEAPAYFERRMPAQGLETVPIIERVDYSGEMRPSSQEIPTIYLLEQCSDSSNRTNRMIKY